MLSKACEVGKKSLVLPFATDHSMYRPDAVWAEKGHAACLFHFVPTVISGFSTLLWVFNSSFNHLGNRVLEKFLWPLCMVMFRILLDSTCQHGRPHS